MTEQNTGKTPFNKRGSEDLTKDELKALKRFIKNYKTMTKASGVIGIHRSTLLQISRVGSGSPYNINIIREKINIPA